jgi:hypothetical protein
MQELLLVNNRHKKVRVTALGGGVIGFILSAVVAVLVIPPLLEQRAADSLAQEQRLRKTAESNLAALKTDYAALVTQSEVSCDPLIQVVSTHLQAVNKTMLTVADFPAFKTEPYKTIQAAISVGLEAQRADTLKLRAALDSVNASGGSCFLKKGDAKADEAVLWNGESFGLYKDGWRKEQKK